MFSKEEFLKILTEEGIDTVLEKYILSDGAEKISMIQIERIKEAVATMYNTSTSDVKVIVVGSAKLGFSLCEKPLPDGNILPRYRPFRAGSDIDVAVICHNIFYQIWYELSRHANGHTYIPWNSKKLGDYLMYGWWRPDKFPNDVRLRKCDDWWDCFRTLSTDRTFLRRKVRGGIYYSLEQLKLYQARTLKECLAERELMS